MPAVRVPVALVVAWVLAFAGVPTARADSAAAEALFERGRALMEEGAIDEACAAFASSMDEEPSAGTLLNLALCHEKQGKIATAWAEYKKAVPLFRGRKEERRADFAQEQADALAPKLSYLRVVVDPRPPGLHVERNGDDIPLPALGTELPVDPGLVVITAAAPGFAPFRAELEVAQPGTQEVTVTLEEAPEPPPSPAPSSPTAAEGGGLTGFEIAGLTVGGVGVALAVAGGVLGGLVLSDASDAESDPTLCPDRRCTPAGREAIDAAESKALGANILIGVGAGAAVGGVLMFLLAPEPSSEVAVAPRLSPREAGVDVRVAF